MASAYPLTGAGEGIGGSRTVRQFARSLAVAVAAAGVGCAVYLGEKWFLPHVSHFAENPLELMVRCLGLAHFLVGWLFLFSSPRLRNGRSVARLITCSLVGVAACLTFAGFGSLQNPLLFFLFYGSFLFHEVRDEAVIYQTYENVRPSKQLDAFSLAVALLFLTLLAAGYALFLLFVSAKGVFAAALGVVAVGLAGACGFAVRRFLKMADGGMLAFLAEHRPLVMVYAALVLIMAVSAPLGSIGLLVLLHAASWLVFVCSRLRERPAARTWNPWTWLRSTPAGFLVLHLGLALVLFVLIGARVYVWGRVGFISEILASRSFCYWALMHICMSFWSSR